MGRTSGTRTLAGQARLLLPHWVVEEKVLPEARGEARERRQGDKVS